MFLQFLAGAMDRECGNEPRNWSPLKDTTSWMVYRGHSNSHSLPIAPASFPPTNRKPLSFCSGSDPFVPELRFSQTVHSVVVLGGVGMRDALRGFSKRSKKHETLILPRPLFEQHM